MLSVSDSVSSASASSFGVFALESSGLSELVSPAAADDNTPMVSELTFLSGSDGITSRLSTVLCNRTTTPCNDVKISKTSHLVQERAKLLISTFYTAKNFFKVTSGTKSFIFLTTRYSKKV